MFFFSFLNKQRDSRGLVAQDLAYESSEGKKWVRLIYLNDTHTHIIKQINKERNKNGNVQGLQCTFRQYQMSYACTE